MKRRVVQLAYVFAGWTVLALGNSAHEAANHLRSGARIAYIEDLRPALFDCWIWAALTPAIVLFAKRFAFVQRTWRRAVPVYVAGCIGACVLHGVGAELVHVQDTPANDSLWLRAAVSFYEDFWIYVLIVLIAGLLHYYWSYRERALAAASLGQALTRAELQALRNQLNPHLLFNTLNSIAALMHEDVRAADDMLNDLSQLLRAYLSGGQRQETSLSEELELVRAYVGIQKRRFGDRLSFSSEIGSDVMDAQVPALLLQPLVENAIVHGIAPGAQPGSVRVVVVRRGDDVVLEVSDDGAGMTPGYKDGIGLSTTRARLRQLYGLRQSFDIRSGHSAGVTVSIHLPLRLGHSESGRGSPR